MKYFILILILIIVSCDDDSKTKVFKEEDLVDSSLISYEKVVEYIYPNSLYYGDTVYIRGRRLDEATSILVIPDQYANNKNSDTVADFIIYGDSLLRFIYPDFIEDPKVYVQSEDSIFINLYENDYYYSINTLNESFSVHWSGSNIFSTKPLIQIREKLESYNKVGINGVEYNFSNIAYDYKRQIIRIPDSSIGIKQVYIVFNDGEKSKNAINYNIIDGNIFTSIDKDTIFPMDTVTIEGNFAQYDGDFQHKYEDIFFGEWEKVPNSQISDIEILEKTDHHIKFIYPYYFYSTNHIKFINEFSESNNLRFTYLPDQWNNWHGLRKIHSSLFDTIDGYGMYRARLSKKDSNFVSLPRFSYFKVIYREPYYYFVNSGLYITIAESADLLIKLKGKKLEFESTKNSLLKYSYTITSEDIISYELITYLEKTNDIQYNRLGDFETTNLNTDEIIGQKIIFSGYR